MYEEILRRHNKQSANIFWYKGRRRRHKFSRTIFLNINRLQPDPVLSQTHWIAQLSWTLSSIILSLRWASAKMRSFLTVLASSLLLSVPVHSHVASSTVHPYDLSHTDDHSNQKSDIRIYVKIGSTIWDSEKNNVCHKDETPCAEEDDDCRKFHSTCPKKTTNRYGFRCKKKFFNQKRVMAAARKGCLSISKNNQKGKFPKAHLGKGYSKEGPYTEWPINKDGGFFNWFRSRKYRLVMTMDCTVVGAITKNRKGKGDTRCSLERH